MTTEPLDLDAIRQRVELTQRAFWFDQRRIDLEALLAEVSRLRAAEQRVRASVLIEHAERLEATGEGLEVLRPAKTGPGWSVRDQQLLDACQLIAEWLRESASFAALGGAEDPPRSEPAEGFCVCDSVADPAPDCGITRHRELARAKRPDRSVSVSRARGEDQ